MTGSSAADGSSEGAQLSRLLDHSRVSAVIAAVRHIFLHHYPSREFRLVDQAFRTTLKLYAGRFSGYKACNTDYHDLCHVLQVFSATARLLDGYLLSGKSLAAEQAVELLVAALLHDSGYIQEAGDEAGSGAKYTTTHVDRSSAFTLREAAAFRLEPARAGKIARLILGTDLGRRWPEIAFSVPEEEEAAAMLAAADILGQMGDRAYLEKLLFLYYEFREAGIQGYGSAFEILEKTLGFYVSVKQRLDTTLGKTAGLARIHFRERYGVDRDLYREAIERQMAYLQKIVADDSSNFRKKLKRMDLEKLENERLSRS